MKKMILAFVALFVMSTSVLAQSKNDSTGRAFDFDRVCSYLELTSDQREPVATAMTQLGASMASFDQQKDAAKAAVTWDKIQTRHKKQMKQLLTDKQYKKYVTMFDTTVRNTGERMKE